MASFVERNASDIEESRGNQGKIAGRGFPILLLTTTGAKTGERRVSPLAYEAGDDVLYVIAAKRGAPTHPAWYFNLVANPDVTVEVGSETYEATASSLQGEERDRVYAKMAAALPVYGEYQEKTDRVIPVVAIARKR